MKISESRRWREQLTLLLATTKTYENYTCKRESQQATGGGVA